ncbi:MAG: hypothetical protein HQK67_10215 [Desulfamplus sp.]|nr:hypothetical protein [Desulfamplus sp.]
MYWGGGSERLPPNSYFNAAEYRIAWAKKQFDINTFGSMITPPLAKYDNEIATGVTPWEHYLKYGAAIGVNPSNSFDESDFLKSVINFYGLDMSVDALRDIATGAGVTPLDYFVDYVAGNSELVSKMPAPSVPSGEKVNTSPAAFSVKAPAAVEEGDSVTFTVTLSHQQYQTTNVTYKLTGQGGAVIGVDTDSAVSGSSNVLIFTPLATSRTITVPVTHDSIKESGEGIVLTLSNPGEGTKLGSAAKASVSISDLPVLIGKVIDGYVAGATVFADANGDGIWNEGEAKATTDADGEFVLEGGTGTIIATGGIDIATNKPFVGTMTAPAGSTVVNPLTTLQQAFVANGQTVAEAASSVATALGLSSGAVDCEAWV